MDGADDAIRSYDSDCGASRGVTCEKWSCEPELLSWKLSAVHGHSDLATLYTRNCRCRSGIIG